MTNLLDNSRQISTDLPSYSDFLASLPIEAKMHPFSDLLQQRADHQDRTFRKLASIGIESGEIDFLSEDEATEVIRSIVMGWFFEKHFRQEEIPRSAESILAIFKEPAEYPIVKVIFSRDTTLKTQMPLLNCLNTSLGSLPKFYIVIF